MQNIFKSKYSLGLFFLIVIILLVFLFKSNKSINNPTQVLAPDGYPEGTTVELWENVPPDFPKEVIIENKKIDHADVVNSKDGKKQITISYTSDKAMPDLAGMYIASFENSGWKMMSNNISPLVATVFVTRNAEKLIITIVPALGAGSTATFQYEKSH
jgi:hypothetical protein